MKAKLFYPLLLAVLISCTKYEEIGNYMAELVSLYVSDIEIGAAEYTVTIDTKLLGLDQMMTFDSLDNWKDIPTTFFDFDSREGLHWNISKLIREYGIESLSITNPNMPDETINCIRRFDSTGKTDPLMQVTFPENKTGKDRYFVFIYYEPIGKHLGQVCILQHGIETKK